MIETILLTTLILIIITFLLQVFFLIAPILKNKKNVSFESFKIEQSNEDNAALYYDSESFKLYFAQQNKTKYIVIEAKKTNDIYNLYIYNKRYKLIATFKFVNLKSEEIKKITIHKKAAYLRLQQGNPNKEKTDALLPLAKVFINLLMSASIYTLVCLGLSYRRTGVLFYEYFQGLTKSLFIIYLVITCLLTFLVSVKSFKIYKEVIS